MLILSRLPGEVIHIGPDIKLTVVGINPGCVRIGIEAPESVKILRSELIVSEDCLADRIKSKTEEN